MILEKLALGPLQVNCYVLGCEVTHQGIVVDPAANVNAILSCLQDHGLHLARIVSTHAHFDHLLAAQPLREATWAKFCLHEADLPLLPLARRMALSWLGADPGELAPVDEYLQEGAPLTFGEMSLDVRHTPGHSPGSVVLIDRAGKNVFTGDLLFCGSIGRTDLQGGDMAQLLESIRTQVLTLPDDFSVLPGHGDASKVGWERRSNPYLVPGGTDVWD